MADSNQKPKIKILEITKTAIKFQLLNSSLSYANALRRILISETPCLAFDSAEIRNNTSFISDEMLAHRIGLLPIFCNNIDDFIVREQCACTGSCPKCKVVYRLDVKAGNETKVVYSSDLVNESAVGEPGYQTRVSDLQVILAKLGPYEKLSATLAAHKSVGMEHAKWQPAVVSMNYDGGEDEAPGLAPADFDFEVEAVGHMGPAPLVRRALAALEQKLFFVGDRFRKLSEFGEN